MRSTVWLLGAALAACAAPVDVARTEAPVVYGSDDRLEPFEHPDASLRAIARGASVALFDRGALIWNGSTYALPITYSLGEAQGLCEGQRFSEQPTAAWCSGTLVAPDLVLTAAHCIPDEATCAATTFVFDYLYEASGELATIDESDVYGCAAVEHARLDADGDYALVRLDRPVADRAPAPLNPRALDPEGSSLHAVGYGSGIPMKIDSGGVVLGPEGPNAFLASTDSFTGQSGGGVFDDAGALIGLLVSGRDDYARAGDCFVVAEHLEDEAGERVQRLEPLLRSWCDLREESPVCEALPPPESTPPVASCAAAPNGGRTPAWLPLLALAAIRRSRQRE